MMGRVGGRRGWNAINGSSQSTATALVALVFIKTKACFKYTRFGMNK